jgi:integrase
LSTGEKVLPENWTGNRVESKVKGSTRINKYLSNIEADLLNAWSESRGLGKEELKGLVRRIVKGDDQPNQSQKKTLLDLVQSFIAQYELEKDKQTVTKYRTLLNHLTNYSKSHPVALEYLDHNFHDGFKRFLYGVPNPNHRNCDLVFSADDNCYHIHPCDPERGVISPVGLFDDIVFNHIRNIKVICKWAEKRDYPIHKAYKDWQIIKRDYDPIYLTKDELERLENVVLPKHLDVARDFLVLECRTGQRISDLKRFTRSALQDDVWTFKQKKGSRLTTKTISLPLVGYCATALLIFQKYNYELPKLSDQKINKYLKQIGKLAEIDSHTSIERWAGNKRVKIEGTKNEFLSTHTGRKTFITQTLQDPNFTAKMVMDITGIRSFKTLNHYNGKSEIGNIRKALESMGGKTQLMKVV